MPKNRVGQDVQAFQHLTEKLRKGRQGVKPEYIPELTAWLLLQSASYDRCEQSVKQHARHMSDEYHEGMMLYYRHAQAVLKALLLSLEHGWERCHWNDACGKVADQLGIVYGESLPADLTHVGDMLPDVECAK